MRGNGFAILFVPVLLAAQPAFEASEIKEPSTDIGGFRTNWSRTQVELRNCSLRQCIETAYGLRPYALSGPAWLDSVHFDVVAKMPAGAKPAEFGPMLQTLLAERFLLKAHEETGDVPGYLLTVGKGGAKMKESAPDAHSGTGYGPTMVRCTASSMAVFADQLSRALERPVSDETSLTGTYDFQLRWTSDADVSNPGPSVLTAIQEQLGLKLQTAKVPVKVLVVDSASRAPTDN